MSNEAMILGGKVIVATRAIIIRATDRNPHPLPRPQLRWEGGQLGPGDGAGHLVRAGRGRRPQRSTIRRWILLGLIYDGHDIPVPLTDACWKKDREEDKVYLQNVEVAFLIMHIVCTTILLEENNPKRDKKGCQPPEEITW